MAAVAIIIFVYVVQNRQKKNAKVVYLFNLPNGSFCDIIIYQNNFVKR